MRVTLPIPSQLQGLSRGASPGWGTQEKEGWGCSQDPHRDTGPAQLFWVNTGKPVCSPQECTLKCAAAPRNPGDLPLPLP